MRAKAKKKIIKKIIQHFPNTVSDLFFSDEEISIDTSHQTSTESESSENEVQQPITSQSFVLINRSIEKTDLVATFKSIAATSVKTLSIHGITINSEMLPILCDSLNKNSGITSLTLMCTLASDEDKTSLFMALMSLTKLRFLELNTELGYNNIEVLTQLILNNPYISQIKSQSPYQPKSSKTEINFAKAVLSSKYLTNIYLTHKFCYTGINALSLAHKYNQSITSISAIYTDKISIIKPRQVELDKQAGYWIALSQGKHVECNITKLFNYAYNHYPAFKGCLATYDIRHKTKIEDSLFSNIDRFIWSYNLGSVCKKALLITRNVKSDNMDNQDHCIFLNIPSDIINYILCIAQEAPFDWSNNKVNWRREITEEEFDKQLEYLV